MEKAYAKFYSCYEFIEGGFTVDALIDLTGGFDETVKLNNIKDRFLLWEYIKRSFESNSLMGANIFSRGNYYDTDPQPFILQNGLIINHAYAITNICEIDRLTNKCEVIKLVQNFPFFDTNLNKLRLIRLRNPWGRVEWKKRYSDFSVDWNNLNEEQKSFIELNNKEDGEFW